MPADGGTVPEAEQVAFDSAAGRWILLGSVLGSGVASLDATVVNVALPRLGADLDVDFAGMQWVLNGYTLSLASLILLGGSLGDRFGRRRVFVIGVVWFAVASLLCAVAPNIEMLVAARVLQGIGGSLLTPGSLAILQSSFRGKDRARAIGAWSGFGGMTAAIGPFLGGYLVDVASWRWIFLINLPLAAVVVVVAVRHMPESLDPTAEGPIDVVGAVLGALGLATMTYGLIMSSWGFGLTGVAVLALFLLSQRRGRNPMLPLDIFRARQFSAANAVTFVLYAALGIVLFLIGLVLQIALGYSPVEAGAALLPITVVMLVFSARSGALAQRIGPRLPMTFGPLVVAVALLQMTRIEPGASYPGVVLPALLTFGGGLALTVAPLTATALAAADQRHSGLASGVNNAVARVGGLLAVAAVPLVAGIDPTVAVGAEEIVRAFHRSMLFAAGLSVAAGALAYATIRADVLEEPEAEEGVEVEEATPCFHCGVEGVPLVAHADR
jgi:EmrB/QacA subfamily drug resistance transporter